MYRSLCHRRVEICSQFCNEPCLQRKALCFRMDSGVVLDKQRERPRYQKMTSVPHGADWEGAGVAGVKIFKKLAVK